MGGDEPETAPGCERCWPPSAEAASAASRVLASEAELIDESHFHVTVLVCRACSQRFVSVFTELIDWVDSDDPQAWALVPITASEAAGLMSGDAPTENQLDSLGTGRRSLRRDSPKGTPTRTFWSTGTLVGPHD